MVREAEKHADADRQRKVSGVKNLQIYSTYVQVMGRIYGHYFFQEREAVGIWTLVVSQRNFD